MEPGNAVDEGWELLRSFFPADRMTPAVESGALKGWRQDKAAETLLRVLRLHGGGGGRCAKPWCGPARPRGPTCQTWPA